MNKLERLHNMYNMAQQRAEDGDISALNILPYLHGELLYEASKLSSELMRVETMVAEYCND